MDKPNELVAPEQSSGVVSEGRKSVAHSNSDDSFSKRDKKDYKTTNYGENYDKNENNNYHAANYNESPSRSNQLSPNSNNFRSNNTVTDNNELPRSSDISRVDEELNKNDPSPPPPAYGRYTDMDPATIRCVCSPQPSDPYILPCGGTERCETRYGPPPEIKYTNRRGCHHCRNKKKSCSIQ